MSEELATYADLPGLTSVIRVHQVARENRTGRERDSAQYEMSSRSDLTPERALALLRGNCPLRSDREPLTGRARRLAAQHSATFAPSLARL